MLIYVFLKREWLLVNLTHFQGESVTTQQHSVDSPIVNLSEYNKKMHKEQFLIVTVVLTPKSRSGDKNIRDRQIQIPSKFPLLKAVFPM